MREVTRENLKINANIAYYTRLLAVFTALLFAATIILFVAAVAQAWITRDTEKRQLRAYIGIKSGSINVLAGSQPTGTLIMTNSGQTPGNGVVVWTHAQVFRFPIPAVLAGPSQGTRDQLGASVVLPGSIHPVSVRAEDVLTADERQAIDDGESTICVWGEMTYRDMFNRKCITAFRLFVNPQESPRIGEGIALAFLPQGNILK